MKIAALRLILAGLLITASCLLLHAQPEEKFDFYARGPYRDNVPRPQSILRYEPGSFHTTYAQMEQVMRAVAAAASDRIKIYEIGETNEHRMQYVIAVSSPENIARIDDIRANVAKLADPRTTSVSEAAQIAQSTPAIAWMAYTIHGNESASFEAMMQVLYQLAASNEPQTLDILKNCVTLIIPGENPDGHERFVTWYNSVATGDANHNAIEHREPWTIYGRLSHYRFDLNRDTLAMTQIETQHMAAAFQQWHPQVSADHHGQPNQYFFPPDSLPINPNLPRAPFDKWNDMYGRANARAFDANHWDYYVRDVFDAFYPGYWDMYPSMNGAIGMTFETDGGGFKGLRWLRDDGTVATLRSAMAKHYTASLTTLAVTAANKADRLKDYYEFRAGALRDYAGSKMKRVVISPQRDRVKAAELVELLQRSGIEVSVATQAFSSSSAHTYATLGSAAETRTFPAGSYVVDLNQPQRILIKSILEPDTPQDKAFVDDNVARFRRNQMKGSGQPKEDYGFYDITAWSLPLAFGLDAYWTEDGGAVGSRVTGDAIAAAKRGNYPGRAVISYIIPYETDTTGPFIMRLLQDGFRVAVSTKPLNAGGRTWPRGTFVLRVGRNPETLHDALAKLAPEMGVNVFAVNSGYADEGDTGVGGESVISLKAPKIAMVADEAVSQTSYGSIWWNLDRYGIKFTPMTVSSIRGGGLKDYNVLIVPDGSAGRYSGAFGSTGASTLKDWAAQGGTVITIGGASVWATLKDVGLTSAKLVGSADDEEKGKVPADEEKPTASPSPTPAGTAKKQTADPNPNPSGEEMKNDNADWRPAPLPPIASPSADANKVPVELPGSIMRATVDRTSWLTYGLDQDDLPVMLARGSFYRYSKEGSNALVFDAKPKRPLTLSGFVWPGNTERLLAGTSYLIEEPRGAGHVILFAEEPFFRGIFHTTTRPFFNAMALNGVF
ncbi:MAG TPA: M14 family zinc carboxypeptidase [Pyrinomonadaceae bacterium]|nr:M14 family zinc carboxypeptidase [Pyrinomonadaceae bacterium]